MNRRIIQFKEMDEGCTSKSNCQRTNDIMMMMKYILLIEWIEGVNTTLDFAA